MMERNISSLGETLNMFIEAQRTSREQVRNAGRSSARQPPPIRHRYKSPQRSRLPDRRHHVHRQRFESPKSLATSQSDIDDAKRYDDGLPEVFCKKGVLTNFAKYRGKHLCQSLFFNNVACLRLWHRCFPVNFAKFLRTSFCIEHLRWLLLMMTVKVTSFIITLQQ